MLWKTSRRNIPIDRPLVMGILNLTPDSFSDGGRYCSPDEGLRHAERMIADGADIIDIGGESTRPGSAPVSVDAEINRVLPVVEAIARRFETPISIDTSKLEVAAKAVDGGAEIINDVSGLRWEPEIANLAAASKAGLILMHSRGTFETMHKQEPLQQVVRDVISGLDRSITTARARSVVNEQIVLDVGIGFGKTFEQNLELLAKLDKIVIEFKHRPVMVGVSRKSFIGKILGGALPEERLAGSLAAGIAAVNRGAQILRVHDVKETVDALKVFGLCTS